MKVLFFFFNPHLFKLNLLISETSGSRASGSITHSQKKKIRIFCSMLLVTETPMKRRNKIRIGHGFTVENSALIYLFIHVSIYASAMIKILIAVSFSNVSSNWSSMTIAVLLEISRFIQIERQNNNTLGNQNKLMELIESGR